LANSLRPEKLQPEVGSLDLGDRLQCRRSDWSGHALPISLLHEHGRLVGPAPVEAPFFKADHLVNKPADYEGRHPGCQTQFTAKVSPQLPYLLCQRRIGGSEVTLHGPESPGISECQDVVINVGTALRLSDP